MSTMLPSMQDISLMFAAVDAGDAAWWGGPIVVVVAGMLIAGGASLVWAATRLKRADREADQIAAQMQELRELSRQLAASLDERAGKIERLLTRGEALAAELEGRGSSREARPARGETGSQRGAGDRPVEDRLMQAVEPARFEPKLVRDEGPSDPVQQQVYQLSDLGLSPLEIARRLQQPTGQVELMLSLRARLREAGR